MPILGPLIFWKLPFKVEGFSLKPQSLGFECSDTRSGMPKCMVLHVRAPCAVEEVLNVACEPCNVTDHRIDVSLYSFSAPNAGKSCPHQRVHMLNAGGLVAPKSIEGRVFGNENTQTLGTSDSDQSLFGGPCYLSPTYLLRLKAIYELLLIF